MGSLCINAGNHAGDHEGDHVVPNRRVLDYLSRPAEMTKRSRLPLFSAIQ